jgi:hypothetical protein
MNEYLKELSRKPVQPEHDILRLGNNQYYKVLSSDSMGVLAISLSTPGVENFVSRELAARFNTNNSPYDSAIDDRYITAHVGGSTLHHNLDGSHTFAGAMDALRRHFPGDSDFNLHLNSLEHLARDFTTPSGINPFLEPHDFLEAKATLEDIGISPAITNDLLNFNAAEVATALVGAGAILFALQHNHASAISAQTGRLATTYFFAGNVLGMIFATAVFLRLAIDQSADKALIAGSAVFGAGQLVLAAALFPSLPISIALIIGATAVAAGRSILSGGYDLAVEMERLFSTQFPKYRSYLACL